MSILEIINEPAPAPAPQPAPDASYLAWASNIDKHCPPSGESEPYSLSSAADSFKLFRAPESSAALRSETFVVGGETLSKSAVMSRMQRVFAQIRDWCAADEATAIEKAIKCLDFVTFGELVEPVLARQRRA